MSRVERTWRRRGSDPRRCRASSAPGARARKARDRRRMHRGRHGGMAQQRTTAESPLGRRALRGNEGERFGINIGTTTRNLDDRTRATARRQKECVRVSTAEEGPTHRRLPSRDTTAWAQSGRRRSRQEADKNRTARPRDAQHRPARRAVHRQNARRSAHQLHGSHTDAGAPGHRCPHPMRQTNRARGSADRPYAPPRRFASRPARGGSGHP